MNEESEDEGETTHGDVAIHSGVAGSAETSVIVEPRLVLAHSPLRARVVRAVGLFLLAIDTGITVGALAPVRLRQVYASGTVVTRLGRALVDVDLAASAGEAGRAITVHAVSHRHAEATVLAHVVGTLNGLAFLAAHRARAVRVHVRGTFDAGGRAVLRLEEVLGALGTRGESRVRVHAGRAFGAATIATRSGRLIGERSSWTGLAVLVAS